MREISTEIEIASSPGRVWQVLTAFDEFPQWNPFIRTARGELREGGRLQVQIQPPGHRAMTFRPTLLCVRPPWELRWLGRLWLPRVFDGEHAFVIEALGTDRVRFMHRERFRGVLVAVLWRAMARDTRRGFEEMNGALKHRAESQVAR
jgi:hypothetical protein